MALQNEQVTRLVVRRCNRPLNQRLVSNTFDVKTFRQGEGDIANDFRLSKNHRARKAIRESNDAQLAQGPSYHGFAAPSHAFKTRIILPDIILWISLSE